MTGLVKSWSYSTHNDYNKCPRIVYFKKVLKAEQLPLDPPEGKDEHPLVRGIRVHDAAELYVKQDVELISELQPFEKGFKGLKALKSHPDFKVICEEKWAFTKDWQVTGWDSETAYLRMKLDCLVIHKKEGLGIMIDYKTGRRRGNEVSHMIQAQLYQLAAFLRYPELQHIEVEYWYIDALEITRHPFTRDFGMRFIPLFDGKGKQITSDVEFKPTPSAHACKYCPFGVLYGTGACEFAYQRK